MKRDKTAVGHKRFNAIEYRAAKRRAYKWVLIDAGWAVFGGEYVPFVWLTVWCFIAVYAIKRVVLLDAPVEASREALRVQNRTVPMAQFSEFATSLPLNKKFMLRMSGPECRVVLLIDVDRRSDIEDFLVECGLTRRQRPIDTWLRYNFLALPFVFLALVATIIAVFNLVGYRIGR